MPIYHERTKSYIIRSPEGKYLRLNRREIRPTGVQPVILSPEETPMLWPETIPAVPQQQKQQQQQQPQQLPPPTPSAEQRTFLYVSKYRRMVILPKPS